MADNSMIPSGSNQLVLPHMFVVVVVLLLLLLQVDG
jgi:hypothetical protein